MIAKRVAFGGYIGLFGHGIYTFDHFLKNEFPPSQLPSPLPLPGYKIFGYMGCPLSKVEAINRLQRNLFFSDDIIAPQSFALRRTSYIERLKGTDKPVVVQIEIREDTFIKPEDLEKDPSLKSLSYVPRNSIHLWPWISPATQKRCDLQVRVHHEVTADVIQNGGHWYRGINYLFKKLKIC